MSPDSSAFAPFVPALILRHFNDDLSLPSQGSGKSCPAVALFADVAGSTKIMNQLAQLGRLHGPEEMYRILNAYYEPMVSKLSARGGDVIGFAGDAVLAIWAVADEIELPSAILQATQAALEVQHELNNMELAKGVVLSLRICLGAGELTTSLVTGRQGYWKVAASGAPLNQIRAAGNIAHIGEVYLSREAYAYLDRGAKCERQADGGAFVSSVTPPPFPKLSEVPAVTVLPVESIRPFVQKVVQRGIDAGMIDYINQPRIVSVLFIRLGRPPGTPPSWQYIQDAMAIIQDACARYDGTISQFIEDDKGLISLVAFGLPLAGHEDYAYRAVEAASYLQDPAINRGIPCGIGVSTGLPFCGGLGSPGKRTVYTVTGTDVVRGARLMQLARDGEILCDEETYYAAQMKTAQSFDMLPRFMLKGYDTPTQVFRIEAAGNLQKAARIGREPERKLLQTALDAAIEGPGRVLWLEGEDGAGGTALVDDLVERAARRWKRLGVPDRTAEPPSSPWLSIWRDLLGLRGVRDLLAEQERIESFFASRQEFAPLLNDLFGTSIPDTPKTRGLKPIERSRVRNEQLVSLVAELAGERHVLIILENAHRLDVESLTLACRLAKMNGRITILATAEPIARPNELRDDQQTMVVCLPTLGDEAILDLTRERFHVDQLSAGLAELLRRHSGGNPERLNRECDRLVQQERLVVDHGICELVEPPAEGKRRKRKYAIPLVGRKTERDSIAELLDSVVGGSSRALLVEGESGSGKSRLLAETRRMAEDRVMLVVAGYCALVEKSTPYYPWRAICNELLGLTEFTDQQERNAAVLAALERSPGVRSFAPLLNELLGLSLPEDDVVRQMTGQIRADNRNDALVGLIQALTGGRPTLFILEDAQWADSATWRLAKLVRERLTPVVIGIAVSRNLETVPVEYALFTRAEWSLSISLEALNETDTREFACHHCGAEQLSDPLASLIWRRTQGNPLFIEQMTGHLIESLYVVVEKGIAGLGTHSAEAVEREVPDSIRGLLSARIDGLHQGQQLTAKVSSVIAPLFPTAALSAIYPEASPASALSEHLLALIQERLLRLERVDRVALYDFPHQIIQQVCYELLTSPQRKRLHQCAAEWYETEQSGSGPLLRLIAYHWGRAGFVDKQVEFLSRAGDAALRDGVFREAVTGFTELINLSKERFSDPPAEEKARRGHWEYQLGEAYLGLGDLPAAGQHFRAFLALRKKVNMQSKFGLIADTLAQAFRQLVRRIRPSRRSSATHHDAENREVAATYLRLAKISYFSSEILPGTNAMLRALNLAECHGPSPELATSYASALVLTGLLKWHRAARVYDRLADSVSREVSQLQNKSLVLGYRSMYHLGQGNWEKVEVLARESLDLVERINDHYHCGETQSIFAMLGCFRADYVISKKWCSRIIETAKKSGNKMHTAWALNIDGECDFRLGRIADAENRLKESMEILAGNTDTTEEIRIVGMLAALAVKRGDWVSAQKCAEEVEAIIRMTSSKTCSTLEGLAGLAETRIKLAELSPRNAQARKAAQAALAPLRIYARMFPPGRPRLAVHEGRLLMIAGATEKAVRAWREGLAVAKRLRMPYDTALLHEALYQSLPAHDLERMIHLESTIEIYNRVSMGFEVTRLKAGK